MRLVTLSFNFNALIRPDPVPVALNDPVVLKVPSVVVPILVSWS